MVKASGGRKAALICGSVAYDTILVFPDRFEGHILPDKIHMLNVCFVVSEMRREFGGCAATIAYGLNLLGDEGVVMATAGIDFEPYRARMVGQGMNVDYIRVVDGAFTAQAFITTDEGNNQITAFHPGAMNHAHLNQVTDATGAGTGGAAAGAGNPPAVPDIALGIVAPDGPVATVEHAAQFAAANIPFIFDPGQNLPLFSAEQLAVFIDQATWVTLNDYEWQLLQQKTGMTAADVVAQVEALVVTQGGDGSTIYTKDRTVVIPTVEARAVVDPTGCGDAYRAGLIHGLLHGLDWETTGRIASLMGSIKIESRGPQNHRFTRAEFEHRYRESFGQGNFTL